MPQSLVTIRMDEKLKSNFEFVCNELGMNMSTAITVFAKQVCREGRIPFDISLGYSQGKEKNTMEKNCFEIWIYCENTDPKYGEYDLHEKFYTLEDTVTFLKAEHPRMCERFMCSGDLEFCRVYFSILIDKNDGHHYRIDWNEEGLFYVNDGMSVNIDCSEEMIENDDNYLYDVVSNFIKLLMLSK